MCEPKDMRDERVNVWVNHKSLQERGDLIENMHGRSCSLPAGRLERWR
jgi:hypothetical protein